MYKQLTSDECRILNIRDLESSIASNAIEAKEKVAQLRAELDKIEKGLPTFEERAFARFKIETFEGIEPLQHFRSRLFTHRLTTLALSIDDLQTRLGEQYLHAVSLLVEARAAGRLAPTEKVD